MLSAVVLTKNEEKNIKRCLSHLTFCGEVIVVDDYSADKTVLLAEKQNAVVYKRESKGDFSSQRNFGQEKTNGEWVLFVDADEVVTAELQKEIKQAVTRQMDYNAFYIKRRDWWWGRELWFGETRKVRNKGLVRLMKKNSGSWSGKVHEVFLMRGVPGRLKAYLDHYPHQTVKEFLEKINYYSTLRARELLKQGKKINILEIILYPLGKFLLNYFIYLGFLDGPAGFGYAFFMSFHSFLVRAKLHQYTHV